ncbi:MAG: DNA polymerase III subunit beta [Gemmatales bacterium]|nr:DNA polymerase III subunit beta [Gemmatales bacterium]MDW8223418.1 DNA polymerase III subunit beta [Gemmatales bacterium]
MKAKFAREAFLEAANIVNSVVPSRTTRPILENLRLTLSEDGARLQGTDLETLALTVQMSGVQVEDPGEVLVPAAQLVQMLRALTDEEVVLEGSLEGVTLRGEYSEYELPAEDPQLFPDVAVFEDGDSHQVQAGVLRRLIERVVFATAQESFRYAMNGVLWELDGEKVRLVATDGRRLAVADGIAVQHGGHKVQGTPIVPTRAMTILERHLGDPAEPVFLRIRSQDCIFKGSRLTLHARLVEGRFPPYREVIPRNATARITLTAGPFLAAVKQAAVVADPERGQGVDLTFHKNKVILEAASQERGGRARVQLPIEYTGEKLEIRFNPRFLVEMLSVLEAEDEVTFEFQGREKAAGFRVGSDYLYVLMPMSRDAG